jgi:hypothetical protein
MTACRPGTVYLLSEDSDNSGSSLRFRWAPRGEVMLVLPAAPTVGTRGGGRSISGRCQESRPTVMSAGRTRPPCSGTVPGSAGRGSLDRRLNVVQHLPRSAGPGAGSVGGAAYRLSEVRPTGSASTSTGSRSAHDGQLRFASGRIPVRAAAAVSAWRHRAPFRAGLLGVPGRGSAV